MRRPFHRVLVAFAVALVACEPAPATDAERLALAYGIAATEFDVPRPLLEGIGWVQTRGWMRPGVPAADHGYGVMHLVDGPDEGAPLQRAARLLGLPAETLRTDVEANVRGAAALLRERADVYFGETPAKDPHDLAAWWQVVMHASGTTDPVLADDYAAMVFHVMNRGGATTLEDGSPWAFGPVVVDVSGERLFAESVHALTPDYAQAKWKPANSGNYASTPRSIGSVDLVVIHTAQGSYTGTIGWFQNPAARVSAHYVVRSSDGEVTQMVEHRFTGWHAGNSAWNARSIGIEHEGFVDDPSWLTPAMYQSSANLVRWLCDTLGIPKVRPALGSNAGGIVGHNEVPNPCPNGGFCSDQDPDRDTPRCSRWNDYGGCSTHTDPCMSLDGTRCHWDWTHYMSLVGGTNAPSTGTLTGTVFAADETCATAADITGGRCTKRIAGATVTLAGSDHATTTNANGVYSLRVPPGAWTVRVRAPGYLEGAPALGNPREVTANTTTYGSTILTPDEATPLVLTITRPAAGAVVRTNPVLVEGSVSHEVVALQVGGHDALDRVRDGRFAVLVELPKPGPFRIEASVTDAAENVATAGVDVTFSFDTGVRGVVRDALTGAPLEGVTVQSGALFTRTRDEGRYALALPTGAQVLTFQKPGFGARTVDVVVGETIHTRDVRLLPDDRAIVLLDSPAADALVPDNPVVVAGRVLLDGIARIDVNGVAATLADDRSFTVPVPLQRGWNQLVATVRTVDGLEATASVSIQHGTGCGCSGGVDGSIAGLVVLAGLAVRRRRWR